METVFLKLGGSLITDKDQAYTAKKDMLTELSKIIQDSYGQGNEYRLVIGHGSGSFGHQEAKLHGTRDGVHSRAEWYGFLQVWKQARALNQIVVDTLTAVGLPVLSFPPVSAILTDKQKVIQWDTKPIEFALSKGLIPVIYGDVIFDQSMNGTILSTEEIFQALAKTITPDRILIAGIEKGVWKDFPSCTSLIEKITPSNFLEQNENIRGSTAVDVTGGMLEKVNQMLNLVQLHPQMEIQIFSAANPHDLNLVLQGKRKGTLIKND